MTEMAALKEKLDSGGMYSLIGSMPSHMEDGFKIARAADLRGLELETFQSVIVAGMGGSAIAGDIARSYLYRSIQIPFVVCRHYHLPAFVNRKALVICSSYSGNTEETLAAYNNAMDDFARVFVITSGGKLYEKAVADGVPVIRIKGGLQPRAALGYSIASLLILLGRLGLCEDQSQAVSRTASSMKSRTELFKAEDDNNPALLLAKQIYGTIPVIYSGYEKTDAVATRFKGQISENAETLAFANVFPEQNHNELVGWNNTYGLNDKFTVIMLRDIQEHKRIALRMEIVASYLRDMGIKVIALENRDGDDLERIFYFIQLLDFTSYYLALLNGVDPTPVTPIDYLKNRLKD